MRRNLLPIRFKIKAKTYALYTRIFYKSKKQNKKCDENWLLLLLLLPFIIHRWSGGCCVYTHRSASARRDRIFLRTNQNVAFDDVCVYAALFIRGSTVSLVLCFSLPVRTSLYSYSWFYCGKMCKQGAHVHNLQNDFRLKISKNKYKMQFIIRHTFSIDRGRLHHQYTGISCLLAALFLSFCISSMGHRKQRS